jgi:hypothetical protein
MSGGTKVGSLSWGGIRIAVGGSEYVMVFDCRRCIFIVGGVLDASMTNDNVGLMKAATAIATTKASMLRAKTTTSCVTIDFSDLESF